MSSLHLHFRPSAEHLPASGPRGSVLMLSDAAAGMTSKAKGCSVLLLCLVDLISLVSLPICQALGWNFLIGGGAL